MREFEQWDGFTGRLWKEGIDVRDFIQNNYTPYDGDEKFLEGPTEATDRLWGKLQELQKEERAKGGVLDMETDVVSGITAYGAAYIDDSMKDLEQVVGLQTDKPLKRAFMPYGGIKMAEQSCETYGYKPSEKLHEIFTKYHKTHNQGVFDIYTPEMLKARHNKILTGLPDTYGRGRIVGDYRRVALYGIDYLIERKKADFAATNRQGMRRGDFQLREEIADQVRALQDMKVMAQSYGYDISEPAKNAREAVQWLYFGYLAAIKTQNGAAMSVGRISMALNFAVYGVGFLFFDRQVVVYSILFTCVTFLCLDRAHLQNVMVTMLIITKKPEMEQLVFEYVGRGVTKWEGEGAYSGEQTEMLLTVVSKKEALQLRKALQKQDPNIFVILDDNISVVGNFQKRV